MTTQPQESSSSSAGTAASVAAVAGLVARGAVLHLAVGATTVAWDWWRQQRRRAALVVPAPARSVAGALPFRR